MTSRGSATVALLVVPPGTRRPEPLAEAISAAHPDWLVRPVWAGDPQLRPVLAAPCGPWFDVEGEASPARQLELVSCPPEHAVWLRALRAVRRSLHEGAARAVVLRVGAVAVLDRLDSLQAPLDVEDGRTGGPVAVVVPRAVGPLLDDLLPDETDLLTNGSWSTDVVAFAASAGALLDWLEQMIRDDDGADGVGRVLDRAVNAFDLAVCRDSAIGVGAFRWDVDEPVLLDVPHFDPAEPWVLDARRGRRGRVEVAAHPGRRAVVERSVPQLAGADALVSLPGGLLVDDVVRAVVRSARRGDAAATPGEIDDVPPPFSDATGFRAWLEPRYWSALHGVRRDLAVAFPSPNGADAGRFRDWGRRAFIDDRVATVLGVPDVPDRRWEIESPLRAGVDVVGYHTRESSLGDVVRRICEGLAGAGVEHTRLDHRRTASPEAPGVPEPDRAIRHRHTLAVVNADQFPGLALDHPELFAAGRHLVGYWFWELEHVPRPMREVARSVDEIWVGSQFVADAFRAVTDTPVRRVPIPLAEPVASACTRASFPMLAPLGDRFVFAVVFDHFSVTERKNPVGVVEAFRRAFRPGEGPVLVVKSMNASRRWPQHQHVVHAAGGRPDIVLWDEHLARPDHMALIREVDALVSLHRSEGLGLHLAEAMWLGTPVIATRYSGNLDFMDDECSILVDATMTPVVRGEGVYPPEAQWADPDLDQAAAAMRRLVEDTAFAQRLSDAGRRRMEQQPSLADTGRLVAGLLGLSVPGAGGMAS